ncbi:hypothetical protein GQ54DRAFT_320858 [Martensiomyces pterosporus]|nr:hypothetical protein GQ54DRAFT_320858 [Martensiomyces pterosporus]
MLVKLSSILALVAASAAHMTFVKPCARYSPDSFCPKPPAGEQVDYDMTTSIGSEGQAVSPICKHTKPYDKPVATWSSGTATTITFSDGNGHEGGHCEFSISYDGGTTFVVLSQQLKYCFYNGPANTDTPSVLNYNVPLPANLPGSPRAVFAWTWVNASGNREFYMNCADVAIVGPAGSFTGKQMTILNYPGYPVIPEFLGNYNTGIQYYTNGTQVTVSGPGYSGGSGSTSSAPVTTTTTTTAKSTSTTTTSAPPVSSTTTSAPASSSTSSGGGGSGPVAGGSCPTDGVYQCADTTGKNANYFLCLYGKWSPQSCGSGTACFQSGTSVSCSWPSS